MKKLLMTFLTAALLTVCLCVPALAVEECEHNWTDGVCSLCGYVCPHSSCYNDADSLYHVCEDCGFRSLCYGYEDDCICDGCNYDFVFLRIGGCSHMYIDGIDCFYVDSSGDHRGLCSECLCSFSCYDYQAYLVGDNADSLNRDYFNHSGADCQFCSDTGNVVPFDALEILESGARECEFLMGDIEAAIGSGIVIFCYRDDGHYVYCTDCGAYVPFMVFTGEDFPHTGTDCVVCATFSSGGHDIVPFPTASPGVLPTITDGVTAAAGWAGVYAETISNRPLLFFGVLLGFIGFGVGIFKRLSTC